MLRRTFMLIAVAMLVAALSAVPALAFEDRAAGEATVIPFSFDSGGAKCKGVNLETPSGVDHGNMHCGPVEPTQPGETVFFSKPTPGGPDCSTVVLTNPGDQL